MPAFKIKRSPDLTAALGRHRIQVRRIGDQKHHEPRYDAGRHRAAAAPRVGARRRLLPVRHGALRLCGAYHWAGQLHRQTQPTYLVWRAESMHLPGRGESEDLQFEHDASGHDGRPRVAWHV